MQSQDHFDVIVLGGGIVGVSTADALQRRGQHVLLLEQFAPGHDRGSSHGDGRITRFAYPEPIYVEMAMLTYPAWEELEHRAGERFYQRCGGCDCGPAGAPQLAELEANFTAYDLPFERMTAAEASRRFPHLHLDAGSEAIHQPDTGVLFATPAVLALWRLLQAAGVTTRTGERVERIEANGEQVTVHSRSGGQWTAGRLVIAAGGWAKRLLARLDLDLPLVVTQEQVAHFPPADDLDHRAGQMPVVVDYHQDPPFYVVPQIEVPGVKVGWHHTGPAVDPDEPQPANEENLATVQAFVGRRLPHLNQTPVEVGSCFYTNTPDYHFILDRHPALPNVVIGAGFSGHGFKFGPVLGRVLADLALDQPPPLPLDTFAIRRFFTGEPLPRRTGA